MPDLTKIELNFENCDSVTIDASNIEEMKIEEITENTYYSRGDLIKTRACENFWIVIKPKANVIYHEFQNENRPMKIFDRLRIWQDIVSVTLHYSDGTAEQEIYIPWENDFQNNNRAMRVTENRGFEISISIIPPLDFNERPSNTSFMGHEIVAAARKMSASWDEFQRAMERFADDGR